MQEKDEEIKKLQEELSVQKALNRNREQLLAELDQKNTQMRSMETSLKMLKNDLTIQEQQNKTMSEKFQRALAKTEELEKKLALSKETNFTLEKQKEQLQIESEAKIVFLNQKLLTKLGQNEMSSLEQSSSEHAAHHVQFMELLKMCRADIGEVLTKVTQQLQEESQESEKLRAEILSLGQRMNESKLFYEKKLSQMRDDLHQQY